VKRLGIIIFSLAVLGLVFMATRSNTPEASRLARQKSVLAIYSPATNPIHKNFVTESTNASAPLLGEKLLRDYASPKTSPENDLKLLAHLMDNFSLLVKGAADRPLSANEDWAAAFRGRNPAHERFLPDAHAVLDAQGRLVDRWGTPLFFHALGGHRFELRSAGPDRRFWTADDLHRNSDGSFRRGAALNPLSLLSSPAR
jgi:hypothetical protein